MVASKAAWSSASSSGWLSVVVTDPPCSRIGHLLTYRSVNTASGQPVAQAARSGHYDPMATERSTFLLDETQIPTQWYNVVPDLPAPPPPPLHPGTREPVGPDDLAPLFPMALIQQEVTTQS